MASADNRLPGWSASAERKPDAAEPKRAGDTATISTGWPKDSTSGCRLGHHIGALSAINGRAGRSGHVTSKTWCRNGQTCEQEPQLKDIRSDRASSTTSRMKTE